LINLSGWQNKCCFAGKIILQNNEGKVMRRIFGPKKEAVTWSGENHTLRSFIVCALHPVLLRHLNQRM